MNRLDEYIKKYEDIHTGKSTFITVVDGKIENIFLKTPTVFGDGVEFVKKVVPYIDDLIKNKQRAVSILDYGCGQALHTYKLNYSGWQNIPSFQNNTLTSYFEGMIQCHYCYDPAVPRYSVKPEKGMLFDMVVLADVMEHIPEEHIEEVIQEAMSYCKEDGLIMFTVSGNVAYSNFPNKDGTPGENAHLTRKPLDWWKNVIVNNNPKQVAFVLMYTNNEIFKDTNGRVNCLTIQSNSSKYTISPKQYLKRIDK